MDCEKRESDVESRGRSQQDFPEKEVSSGSSMTSRLAISRSSYYGCECNLTYFLKAINNLKSHQIEIYHRHPRRTLEDQSTFPPPHAALLKPFRTCLAIPREVKLSATLVSTYKSVTELISGILEMAHVNGHEQPFATIHRRTLP